MGWTAPRTYTVGEIITKTILDTHVKDNLRYLKGLDGIPTVESGLIIDNTGGDEYLQIPSLTTTERNALTPVNGMVIYNETTTEFNKYEAGAWVDLASGTDHGGLDGLGDDDHTIYQKEDLLTTQGDIPYATAASTWARLPKGTGTQLLRMNAGATAPEWWTSSGAVVSSGTYSGDSSANRAITHSLGLTPKLVTIIGTNVDYVEHRILGTANIYSSSAGTHATFTVTIPDATNFYVGNASDYTQSANSSASSRTYAWVAIG